MSSSGPEQLYPEDPADDESPHDDLRKFTGAFIDQTAVWVRKPKHWEQASTYAEDRDIRGHFVSTALVITLPEVGPIRSQA
jgi:hypothetical protein